MPWETRGGRSYYYRKVRKGGRVFSVYEGGGLAGQLSAERAAAEREEARRVAATTRDEMAAMDAVDAMIDHEWQTVKVAAAGALEAAGYHRYMKWLGVS